MLDHRKHSAFFPGQEDPAFPLSVWPLPKVLELEDPEINNAVEMCMSPAHKITVVETDTAYEV